MRAVSFAALINKESGIKNLIENNKNNDDIFFFCLKI